MVVNVYILYLFSHCVSFALLIIDFIVILHVRLIRVLLKINQSINHVVLLEAVRFFETHCRVISTYFINHAGYKISQHIKSGSVL